MESMARLVDALMIHGYGQNKKNSRSFSLSAELQQTDEGDPIDIVVDFLMPRDAVIDRNKPPIIEDFAVQRADELILRCGTAKWLQCAARCPMAAPTRLRLRLCSIPALLAMKGYFGSRYGKQKDAYDIYYCIRNYPWNRCSRERLSAVETSEWGDGLRIHQRKVRRGRWHITCVQNFVEIDPRGGRPIVAAGCIGQVECVAACHGAEV